MSGHANHPRSDRGARDTSEIQGRDQTTRFLLRTLRESIALTLGGALIARLFGPAARRVELHGLAPCGGFIHYLPEAAFPVN